MARRLRQWATTDVRMLTAFRLTFCACLLARFVLEGTVPNEARLHLASTSAGPIADWLFLLASVAQYVLLGLLAVGYRTGWSSLLLLFVFGALNFSLFDVEPVLLLLMLVLPVGRYVSLDDAMDRGRGGDGEYSVASELLTSPAVAALRVLAVLFLLRLALYLAVLPVKEVGWMSCSALLILVATAFFSRTSNVRFMLVFAGCISLALSGVVQLLLGGALLAPWLGAALGTSLLPSAGFDRISEHRLFANRHALRIYYDQPCGFCRKICYVFASFMLLGRCQIEAAQTNKRAHTLLKENDSWVVFDASGKYELCWAAVLLLMRHSPLWMPLGWLLTAVGMGVWGKPLYRLIGAGRGALSKLTARLLPYRPYGVRAPTPLVAVAGLFAAIVAAHLCISIGYYLTGPVAARAGW